MSFQQGLCGLNAAAQNLDVIGNNVANANTVGFKESSAVFADVYATSLSASAGTGAGIGTAVATSSNSSRRATSARRAIRWTWRSTAAASSAWSNNGSVAYSRNGQFHLDKNGYIVNASGAQAHRATASTPPATCSSRIPVPCACRARSSRRRPPRPAPSA